MQRGQIVLPILLVADTIVAFACAIGWISPGATVAALVLNPVLFGAEFAYVRARRGRGRTAGADG